MQVQSFPILSPFSGLPTHNIQLIWLFQNPAKWVVVVMLWCLIKKSDLAAAHCTRNSSQKWKELTEAQVIRFYFEPVKIVVTSYLYVSCSSGVNAGV